MRAFLFDLDGTLIDHFAAIHRCYAYALERMGLPAPTAAQVRAAVGGGFENSLSKFVPKERMAEATAIYREYWDRTMLDDVKLMPGAMELVRQLHDQGAVQGVLSNKLGGSSRQICDHLGLTPYLAAVVGAKDTAWLKPEARLTAHVLELMRVAADEAILVGDSPFDIAAAHAGGMPAWCVTTGTHSRAELQEHRADRIFADLGEVGRALR